MRALLLLALLGACANDGEPLDIVTCGDRWPNAGKSHCARACNAPEPDSLPTNGCVVTDDGGIHIDCPIDRLAQWDGEYGCCAIPEPAPSGGTYLTWSPCE